MLQKEAWQGRIVYNQSQKDILQKWFQHNPYPDKPSREQMAKEIGIPEYKIQIWFKNHRSKQRQLGSECSLGKDQIQGQDQPQFWIKEYLTKEVKQDQTFGRRSPSTMLVQDFERSQSPDVATRKKMSKQTSIQESRIQNGRSLYPGQSRSESMNSMVEDPNGKSDLTIQQHQAGFSTHPGRSHHFPSSSSFCQNQTLLVDHLPSHVSAAPYVIQRPSVIVVQPTQAMKGNENSSSTLTLRNSVPRSQTLGENFSDTQTDYHPPNQEKCENHKEQISTRKLQLKEYSQPLPEHKKHQSQDLDISYIMQWWDEGCQALIAEWDPQEGTD
ncbi:double homeobox protein B [Erinaceus europaeus]|uniref:Double homeobox protein 4C n=1 Tax=Erinaceus europaeus TaxID=9365 RepID=A0A1S3A0Y7_ERIEU|nr:double homeobox protein B [Erinaceus europaeus]XP_060041137.1 double homeobox protein B [Erinaceus europaeus]XP_060041138.1 double homeobox protein B [Erinaceus europaeus]